MKRDKLTFLIAELILIVLAAFFIHKIFQEDVAQKRVAVILQNSGDTRWEGVINGLKQGADRGTAGKRCGCIYPVSGTGGRYKGDAGLAWRAEEAICTSDRRCLYR